METICHAHATYGLSYLFTSEKFVEKSNKIAGIRIYTGRDDWRSGTEGRVSVV